MADVTTKKLLIEVVTKYEQVGRAQAEMVKLGKVISDLKAERVAEKKLNSDSSKSYIDLSLSLKAAQKEYASLQSFAVANMMSAGAMESVLASGNDTILSQVQALAKLTQAWNGKTAAERASTQGVQLKAQIDSLTMSLQENATILQNRTLMVGGYEEAIRKALVQSQKEELQARLNSEAYNKLNQEYNIAKAAAQEFFLTVGAGDERFIKSKGEMLGYSKQMEALQLALKEEKQVIQPTLSAYDALNEKYRASTAAAQEAYLVHGAQSSQFIQAKTEATGYAMSIDQVRNALKTEQAQVKVELSLYQQMLQAYAAAEAATRELIIVKGADDQETIKSISALKAKGAELDKLNSTMGKYQAKTVNAQYATFSLSQVVREMPNFAIDARLGFMALSNNLPMLAQDFQMLTVQLGSARAAFKAFAASLLGVNTIMVILSTVLIAWGPQMWNWIKSVFAGKKATDSYTQSLGAMHEVMKKGDSNVKSAIAGQVKLKVMLDKAKDGSITGAAAVREYNKTLGESYGKVRSLAEAMDGYQRFSKAFIKAKIAEAAATKLADQTSDAVLKKTDLLQRRAGLSEYKTMAQDYNTIAELAKSREGGLVALQQIMKNYGSIFPKKTPEGFGDIRDMVQSLGAFKGGKEFLAFTVKIGEQNSAIAATEKTLASLYSAENLDWKAQGKDPEQEAKDKAAALQKMADLEAEYRDSQIEAEKGFQSDDFDSKQTYEKRLFDSKDKAERAKLGILLQYKQITKDEYDKQLATLNNQQTKFSNKQVADNTKRMEEAKTALLKLLGENEQIELQETSDAYDKALKDYEDSLGDKSKLSANQIYEMLNFELMAEEEKQKALAAIRDKYRKVEENTSRADIIKQFADETLAAKQNVEEKYNAEKKRIEGELALLNTKYEKNAKMDEKDAARYRKLLEDQSKNDKAYEENKVAVKEFFMDKATELLSSINDIADGFSERDKERVQTNHDEAITANDDKLSKGLISQKAHDNEVKRLDKQLDKEKQKIARDQAIRERLMATISIGMNTAKAIMGIWADFPKMDFGISAGVASGIVGALGLAQAAAVWAQPMPKAAKGMLLQGPSHSGGGVNVNAEGGEAIINRRSTSMFKPLLSAINAAGGGVRFASGGIPVGLANDGGFSARQGVPFQMGPTAREIAQAVAEMQISVSVEQIEKAQTKFVKVRGRANF